MREVDNKLGVGSVQPPKVDIKPKAEEPNVQPVAEETAKPGTKDLNSGAAVAGRSQVPDSGQGAALEKAVNFAVKYPEKIKAADKFFERTYQELLSKGKSPEDAYSTAASLEEVFVEEFPNFTVK